MEAWYQSFILRARAASAWMCPRVTMDACASPVSTAGRCESKEVNIGGLLAAKPG
jgi:hypothetical protein